MKRCFFIANNNIGDSGLSGGDRIFIELARNWKDKLELTILGAEEAINVCKREGLTGVTFVKTSGRTGLKNLFTIRALFENFFKKLTNGLLFVIKNIKLFRGMLYVYSVSDFYPDSIPAFLIKLINPRAVWIAGFYLFAPAPWRKDSPYKGRDLLRGVLYWLSQQPVYWIVNRYADIIFVTSEPDRKRFINKRRVSSKVFAIQGGVNIRESTAYLNSGEVIPVGQRKYDACFIGRFHQQKGVLILMDIWRQVVEERPQARLAMVGNGPLEKDVLDKARGFGIENNIHLFGFLDGEEKFKIFRQSKIVLHPATFDSGGMAAAEAMAWSLPGVGFDLGSLKTYYPRGMVKARQGDYKEFAEEVLKLLSDKDYYGRISKEARDLIVKEWDWAKRAEFVFDGIFGKVELYG